jgi:hypothetical protein
MDHLVGIDDRLGNAGVVRAAQHAQFGRDELLDQGHDAVAGGRGLHDRDEFGLGVDDATKTMPPMVRVSTGQAFGMFFLVRRGSSRSLALRCTLPEDWW